jgi:hypothetical protein
MTPSLRARFRVLEFRTRDLDTEARVRAWQDALPDRNEYSAFLEWFMSNRQDRIRSVQSVGTHLQRLNQALQRVTSFIRHSSPFFRSGRDSVAGRGPNNNRRTS